MHHTSDQHPWFQQARADKHSKYRNYYVWTEKPVDETCAVVVFPDIEKSVWNYDEQAQAYYLHQFYAFQPDLNIQHPEVREEIRKIVTLWLELGASGFRVDAASHMLGARAVQLQAHAQPHEFLRHLRDMVDAIRGNAALIAEADVESEKLADFFGSGDEMHLLFNFMLDNFLFLALPREEAEPIVRGLGMLPDKPAVGQWANFLRNLDELDLDQLSEAERQEVYAAFAPEQDMRIYQRGIRRRLAPMLDGDRRRLELAYSVLFSLPGTPVLVYGDEIGMGDDLSLPERQSVRTPMQWSSERNGGFSSAPPDKLVAQPIRSGEFGYERVNVVAQRRERDSFLNWMQRAIYLRRQSPEIGRGSYSVIETDQRCVLAYRSDWEGGTIVVVHNLASNPCTVELASGESLPEPVIEIFANNEYRPEVQNVHRLELTGYGYRWFRCGSERL